MIRVNLLPHREERRKAQRKQLGILAGMVAVLGIAIAVLVHGVIAGYIAIQADRNEFLKKENTKLDKEIEEIKKLKDEIAALLSRKQVIERLQAERSQSVNLLDQLVRQVPDGVYLKTVKQTGLRVNLTGYAQSNARVSTLMRNFGSSPYLENPDLVEIRSATINNKRISEFTMNVNIKRPQLEEAGKAAAANAVQALNARIGAGDRLYRFGGAVRGVVVNEYCLPGDAAEHGAQPRNQGGDIIVFVEGRDDDGQFVTVCCGAGVAWLEHLTHVSHTAPASIPMAPGGIFARNLG